MFKVIWDGFDSKDDIASAYQLHISDLDDIEILIAKYHTGSYEGSSFVLMLQDGKLFEVNASHCSCYGLEGQWDPEETSLAALKKRNDQFVSVADLMLVENYLNGDEGMGPTMIRVVKDTSGEIMYALKDGSPAKAFNVALYNSVEHRQAYLDAQDVKKLKESGLAKLSAAERKALGL